MEAKRPNNFKFVKGQVIFMTELEFFISVRKMKVLEILNDHGYLYKDPCGEYNDEWVTGQAIRVLENGSERIIPIENLDINTFISKSSRDALKAVKKFTKDIKNFDLNTKSFFVTHW